MTAYHRAAVLEGFLLQTHVRALVRYFDWNVVQQSSS